ncbi:MAG: response regulator transcription factor [Thermodesulfobacteriota bacterium]
MAPENKKVVLVVDDEADFAFIVQKNLKEEGFVVEIAYDGAEALEKIRTDPPDAVILDVMMPEKTGYEVCAELKKDKRLEAIPVILLTAVADHVSSTRYSHHQGITMKADDYLPKPSSVEDLLIRLRRLVE